MHEGGYHVENSVCPEQVIRIFEDSCHPSCLNWRAILFKMLTLADITIRTMTKLWGTR
jgi:hypothetical protein